MSGSRSFALYARLPVWAQNVACSLAGLRMRRERYNRTFRQALAFLERSQWWSLAEQRAYQDERLRQVLSHAYETVPYYREVMDARRLKPADFRSAADLPKLPILDKPTLRQRLPDLISRTWPARRLVRSHTGGTTGTALDLVSDIDTQPWQWAVWWRHRRRFGLDVGQPFIVFAGRKVVPLTRMDPPFWRRNLPMRQTYVSVHHLTRQNMPALVEYLQKRRVAYYSGYPSALYLLAAYLLEQGTRLKHPPRITVTGAETVLPHQRTAIERALQTELADQYGASEQCGNISECEKHRYHVDMEFGVVEFLPLEGLPANTRRIVCTGLHNPAMPLIRYDIGDVATLSENGCSCGRAAPTVTRIDGRIESYILTPDGRQLGRLDFLFKDTPNVEEAQLIQDSLEEVTLRVVRGPRYSAADERHLLDNIRTYLGDQIRIRWDYVPEIPREANGKFRQIVSRIFRDRLAETDGAGPAAAPHPPAQKDGAAAAR